MQDDPAVTKQYDHRQNKSPQADGPRKEELNGQRSPPHKTITYSIQVGAYLLIKNAHQMLNRLVEKGYVAAIDNNAQRNYI